MLSGFDARFDEIAHNANTIPHEEAKFRNLRQEETYEPYGAQTERQIFVRTPAAACHGATTLELSDAGVFFVGAQIHSHHDVIVRARFHVENVIL